MISTKSNSVGERNDKQCALTLRNTQTRSYIISEQGYLRPVAQETLMADWNLCSSHYWLDVESSDDVELKQLFDKFGISSDMQGKLVSVKHSPSFVPGDNLVVIDYATMTDEVDRTHFLTIVCFPNLLLSIHRTPLPQLDTLANLLQSQIRLETSTKSVLLFRILAQFYLENLTLGFQIRDQIALLTRVLFETPENIDSNELLQLKRQITQFGTTSEDQLFCLSILKDAKSPVFQCGKELTRFREVNEFNFEFPLKLLTRMENRLGELHHNYQLYLQEKSNNRLKILTILSAVFLPLTLVAGIYGMNFESMPELGSPYGYPVVLGSMIGMAVGMVFFFRRYGWFK